MCHHNAPCRGRQHRREYTGHKPCMFTLVTHWSDTQRSDRAPWLRDTASDTDTVYGPHVLPSVACVCGTLSGRRECACVSRSARLLLVSPSPYRSPCWSAAARPASLASPLASAVHTSRTRDERHERDTHTRTNDARERIYRYKRLYTV
jgi:hypothetical protein